MIQFNGREYASAAEMPASIRGAYDRAVHETPVLHSGARLAAKLKAKIIINGTEFNNPGEMSVGSGVTATGDGGERGTAAALAARGVRARGHVRHAPRTWRRIRT